jgi:hypothetical protein
MDMALWSVVAEWLRSASARMVQPEAITAYGTVATAAAALAAFLSWKAAGRQERATFTSNLYNKQVDATASLSTQYSAFVVRIIYFYNKEDADSRKLELSSVESSRTAFINALNTVKLVYPKETDWFIEELIREEERVYSPLFAAPAGPMSKARKDEATQFQDSVSKLLKCSRDQLREAGANLDGKRLSNCLSTGVDKPTQG